MGKGIDRFVLDMFCDLGVATEDRGKDIPRSVATMPSRADQLGSLFETYIFKEE